MEDAADAPVSVGLCDDSKNPAAVRMELKGPRVEEIRRLLQAKVQEKVRVSGDTP